MDWQAEVKGDTMKKNTFKAKDLGITGFKSFTGMVTDATTMNIFHSLVEWRGPFIAKEISGNKIAFVGNHTMQHNPLVVAFMPQKPWKWPKVKATFHTVDIEAFYSDVMNRGKIWSTAAQGGNVEKILPRLVGLTQVVLPWLCEQDCIPQKIQCWIKQHSAR